MKQNTFVEEKLKKFESTINNIAGEIDANAHDRLLYSMKKSLQQAQEETKKEIIEEIEKVITDNTGENYESFDELVKDFRWLINNMK